MEKVNFQNFKLIFPVILQIIDLECHGETSLEVVFAMVDPVFKIKKPPLRKTKILISIKFIYSHCLSHSYYLLFSKQCFSKHQIRIRERPIHFNYMLVFFPCVYMLSNVL